MYGDILAQSGLSIRLQFGLGRLEEYAFMIAYIWLSTLNKIYYYFNMFVKTNVEEDITMTDVNLLLYEDPGAVGKELNVSRGLCI